MGNLPRARVGPLWQPVPPVFPKPPGYTDADVRADMVKYFGYDPAAIVPLDRAAASGQASIAPHATIPVEEIVLFTGTPMEKMIWAYKHLNFIQFVQIFRTSTDPAHEEDNYNWLYTNMGPMPNHSGPRWTTPTHYDAQSIPWYFW